MANRGMSAFALGGPLGKALGLPPDTQFISLEVPVEGRVTVLCRVIPDDAGMKALLAFLEQYNASVPSPASENTK